MKRKGGKGQIVSESLLVENGLGGGGGGTRRMVQKYRQLIS